MTTLRDRLRAAMRADAATREAGAQMAAAIMDTLAANPPASQALSEPPAGYAAPAATSRSGRTRRPAATSAVVEAR